MAEVMSLPRLVRFIETVDGSEGAVCPHCGASGRWIHSFEAADGKRYSAMSGCIKLFPVSPVALEDQRLREKGSEYYKKGWTLPGWDLRMLAAVDAFYSSSRSPHDEEQAMRAIRREKKTADLFRKSRGRR